jgi:hypothetical protein
MSRVVVILEGGVVQAVYSDEPGVQVATLDYDVFEDLHLRFYDDEFFEPEFDPALNALRKWEDDKARYLEANPPDPDDNE